MGHLNTLSWRLNLSYGCWVALCWCFYPGASLLLTSHSPSLDWVMDPPKPLVNHECPCDIENVNFPYICPGKTRSVSADMLEEDMSVSDECSRTKIEAALKSLLERDHRLRWSKVRTLKVDPKRCMGFVPSSSLYNITKQYSHLHAEDGGVSNKSLGVWFIVKAEQMVCIDLKWPQVSWSTKPPQRPQEIWFEKDTHFALFHADHCVSGPSNRR